MHEPSIPSSDGADTANGNDLGVLVESWSNFHDPVHDAVCIEISGRRKLREQHIWCMMVEFVSRNFVTRHLGNLVQLLGQPSRGQNSG